jgi:hypothetical protein
VCVCVCVCVYIYIYIYIYDISRLGVKQKYSYLASAKFKVKPNFLVLSICKGIFFCPRKSLNGFT